MTEPAAATPDSADDTLTVSVSALARRLGVAPSTLRTWDRRYGIGPSAHRPGHHRRYTPEDVARLECMRSALAGGAHSAEAARYALNVTATSSSETGNPAEGDILVNSMRTGISAGVPSLSDTSRTTGRRTARSESAETLAAAARARDVVGIRRLVERCVAEHGVVRTWGHTVHPVLDAADAVGLSDADSQLLAECLSGVFATLTVDAPIGTGPAVLLSTLPGHALAGGQPAVEFHVAAAALARVPVNLRVTVPVSRSALGATLSGSAADVVALWCTGDATAAGSDRGEADASEIASLVPWLRRRRRGVTVVAGGGSRNARGQFLPRSVGEFGDVESATECIVAAVRAR